MTSIEKLILRATGTDEATKVASSKPDTAYAKKVSDGLQKVASYQYKESTYDAVCGIMKIAANLLDSVSDSYIESESRANELEKVSSIRSIVDDMMDDGLIDKYSAHEKIAELSSKSDDELNIVREAVKLVGDTSGSELFESDKTASLTVPTNSKKGMFDSVIAV